MTADDIATESVISDEAGELVAWLCPDRNTYVNGAVIVQDGGTTG